jgi:4-amino-4-deoxy-L-arabinose transferase-like glycosyltransferase
VGDELMAEHGPSPAASSRQLAWHLLLITAVSAGFEAAFLHSGLNPYDEGWPLYAAMQLHDGGVLFRDVFFVFPPGHLLAAWIAYAIDPPGIIAARTIYAGFNVLLCISMYLLGRRLMPPGFALLGALLLAVAAPESHLFHYHFGYRYLAIGVLALLAFAKRVESEDSRWLLISGMLTGVALCFRLTPAFSVGVAVGVGVVLLDRDWRRWLRDWSLFAAGIALIAVPAIT